MDSLEMIKLYENVATITNDMLIAAKAGDWQLLAKLEANCSSQIQIIKNNGSPIEMPNEIRVKKVAIIKQILADDKEIRDITEPWMAELSNLIRTSKTTRKLNHAYGAGNTA